MRSPQTLFRAAVAGGAAVVLLTACGGSDDEEEPVATAPTSSSPAAPAEPEAEATAGADAEAAAFCAEVTSSLSGLATLDTASPEEAAAQLQEAAAAIDEVAAPEAIAEDWQLLADALREVGEATQGLDLTTPEGQQQFADLGTELGQELGTAQANITNYVLANCGGLEAPAT